MKAKLQALYNKMDWRFFTWRFNGQSPTSDEFFKYKEELKKLIGELHDSKTNTNIG